MRTEARATDAAEGRIHLADLELADRPDRSRIGHVESENAGMCTPAPRRLLVRALCLVFLIDRKCDAAALDAVLHRHRRVRRLRAQRMIIVTTDALGL